jgi:VWFA-related protein
MAAGADPQMKAAACIALLIGIAAVSPLGGQQPLFRSGIDVVRIDASVTDGRSAVAGLTKSHFAITDNGVPQTVESVSLDTVPLSLMLVLDTSESLRGEALTALIAAARSLVGSLTVEEPATLITFADQVRLAVPTTRDRKPMMTALTGLIAAGATSVNDAIVLSLLHKPIDTSDTRPVMMVFSDGRDTSSWLSGADAQAAVRRSGMLVHVVELRAPLGYRTNLAREVARSGGGRVWSATSAGALKELFGEVLNELRARYLITYHPTGVSRVGWHDVKLTLKDARGDVTARPGYFATPQ